MTTWTHHNTSPKQARITPNTYMVGDPSILLAHDDYHTLIDMMDSDPMCEAVDHNGHTVILAATGGDGEFPITYTPHHNTTFVVTDSGLIGLVPKSCVDRDHRSGGIILDINEATAIWTYNTIRLGDYMIDITSTNDDEE